MKGLDQIKEKMGQKSERATGRRPAFQTGQGLAEAAVAGARWQRHWRALAYHWRSALHEERESSLIKVNQVIRVGLPHFGGQSERSRRRLHDTIETQLEIWRVAV